MRFLNFRKKHRSIFFNIFINCYFIVTKNVIMFFC